MPSKKRKYEARFPPARIKKIMQTDEEIGKVAAAVPVIISRSLEIFLQSLVETTASYTNERKAKTMTTSHLKHCIESETKFDFLKYLVESIADVATQEEEETNENGDKPKKIRKSRTPAGERKKEKRKQQQQQTSSDDDTDSTSDTEEKWNSEKQTIAPPMVVHPVGSTSHSIDSIMAGGGGNSSSSISRPPDIMSTPMIQPTAQFQLPQSSLQQLPPTHYQQSNFQTSSLQQQPQQQQQQQQQIPAMPMTLPTIFQNSSAIDEDDDYDA